MLQALFGKLCMGSQCWHHTFKKKDDDRGRPKNNFCLFHGMLEKLMDTKLYVQ